VVPAPLQGRWQVSRKTLEERIRTPEFKARVERHTKKLDAEEAGWVVLDPKTHRALRSVVRAAEGVRRFVIEGGYEGMEGPADKALFRALDRLSPSKAPRGRAGKGGTR
jgi:hypothetical protein